jgi:hypothetical protein
MEGLYFHCLLSKSAFHVSLDCRYRSCVILLLPVISELCSHLFEIDPHVFKNRKRTYCSTVSVVLYWQIRYSMQ